VITIREVEAMVRSAFSTRFPKPPIEKARELNLLNKIFESVTRIGKATHLREGADRYDRF
jgi:hypothetical protein